MNYCAFEVVAHILSSNSDRFYSLFADPSVAAVVRPSRGFEVVSKAVNFDGDRSGLAVKVEDVRAERVLAAKLQTVGTQAQHPP